MPQRAELVHAERSCGRGQVISMGLVKMPVVLNGIEVLFVIREQLFMPWRTPRTRGLKLIIAYKLAKAPIMLTLAIWLTFAPREAYHFAAQIAHELAAASAFWVRIGHWIEQHLSIRLFRWAAVLAWVDFVSTSLEAILLLMGKAWGEWLVTIGLALLLVPELLSLEHRPSWPRFVVLIINVAVVVYLAVRRLRAARIIN